VSVPHIKTKNKYSNNEKSKNIFTTKFSNKEPNKITSLLFVFTQIMFLYLFEFIFGFFRG